MWTAATPEHPVRLPANGRWYLLARLLEGGEVWCGGNREAAFPLASCAKVVVCAAVLHAVASGRVDPGAQVTLSARDRVEGSGVLKDRLTATPADYGLDALLTLMIQGSDNVAFNALLRLLGDAGLQDFLALAALRNTVVLPLSPDTAHLNRSCLADLDRLWCWLYRDAREVFERTWQWLRSNASVHFLPLMLGGYDIGHKTGILDHTRTMLAGDVGLVGTTRGPLALQVFAVGAGPAEMAGMQMAILARRLVSEVEAAPVEAPEISLPTGET